MSWCKSSPLPQRRLRLSAATAISALSANAVFDGRLSTPGEVSFPAKAALAVGLIVGRLRGREGVCVLLPLAGNLRLKSPPIRQRWGARSHRSAHAPCLAKELESLGIKVYLDDILVHASAKDEHDALLTAVLKRLEENGVHLKAAKCAIPCTGVDLLGYRTQGGSYHPMHSKVQGLLDYAQPNTVKAWQRFHGILGFYRLHVPRLSNIMKPDRALGSLQSSKRREPRTGRFCRLRPKEAGVSHHRRLQCHLGSPSDA